MKPAISVRLGLQQRVFPAYRAPFFEALAAACVGGLSVFAGEPMPDEALGQQGALKIAQYVPAQNLYLGWGPLLMVWQRNLLDWLEKWQPDVLVMEANPRNSSTKTALRWMHARRRPVVGWGLGAPPIVKGPLPGLFAQSRRGFLSQFDALIAYSRTGAEQFVAAGIPENQVFIAPNAVTPRPAVPPPDRPSEYQGGRPLVLFVGRLQERKRVDVLLRACAELPPELQPRLRIVGDGPAGDGFAALAKEVYPAAEFYGARHGAELDACFRAADLFVLPGTGGLAVQQAMSFGLPVIVAEADGTQADLVRAENGWLVPPGDAVALTRCLAAALSDPSQLRQMGRQSYRIVAEEVNLEQMVDVFARVIRVVTAKELKE